MGFKRISEADMAGKGNLGRADTPGVSAGEMQRILDELPREVLAPALNELAGQLEAPAAAGLLGATPPEGLPESTPQTVQGALDALRGFAGAHAARADNPHGVTAAQTGAYTKAETDAAIGQKVTEIGAGDMAQTVYDPTGQHRDVFAAVDGAKAGLQTQLNALAAANTALEEASAALEEANAALGAKVQVFACTLLAGGWTASGTVYTQTVTCPGLLAAYDLEAPQVPSTGVKATDTALKDGLDVLCAAGNCGVTLDGQLKWTCYGSRPTVDLPLRLRRAVVGGTQNAGGSEEEV